MKKKGIKMAAMFSWRDSKFEVGTQEVYIQWNLVQNHRQIIDLRVLEFCLDPRLF